MYKAVATDAETIFKTTSEHINRNIHVDLKTQKIQRFSRKTQNINTDSRINKHLEKATAMTENDQVPVPSPTPAHKDTGPDGFAGRG